MEIRMAHRLTRREFGIAAGATTLAGYGLGRNAHAADTKTLRFIAQSDLRVLDPIWTTAYITRNHGYMVFDTLFALDSKFKPHPQMIGDTASRRTGSSIVSHCATGSKLTADSRLVGLTAPRRSNAGWHATPSARLSPQLSTR